MSLLQYHAVCIHYLLSITEYIVGLRRIVVKERELAHYDSMLVTRS